MNDRQSLITQAIALLREAGASVHVQGSTSALYVVIDEIELTWSEDEGCKILVDGVDITEKVKVVNFGIIPGSPPYLSCRFSNKAGVNVNSMEILMKVRPDNRDDIKRLAIKPEAK